MKMTARVDKALRVAAVAHRNQRRKGADIPYVMHPFAVMMIASEETSNEDVLIACLLHDILEDVPEEYSKEQMGADFGPKVVAIVEGVTKDSSITDWKLRSDAYLKHLEEQASNESVLVSCADKIHNIMSITEDYKVKGDQLWERFNSGKDNQIWWYGSVCGVIQRRLPDLKLIEDYKKLISELEALLNQNK